MNGKRRFNLWTILLMNRILSATGMACLDCSGSCNNPGFCHTNGKCFIRTDVNGLRYRGCADRWRWRGLDISYQGCRYQDYLGWNNGQTLWCLCDYAYCNRLPFDEPPDDATGEPSHRKENLNRNPAEVREIITELDDPSQGDDEPAPFKAVTKGTDFTQDISSNREDYNRNPMETVDTAAPIDMEENKDMFEDHDPHDLDEEVSDGIPNRHQDYMNTQATTQRIRQSLLLTPRNPFPFNPTPSRRWIPYTQSTSMPQRGTPGAFDDFHTTLKDNSVHKSGESVSRGGNANNEGRWNSDVRDFDATSNDDVRDDVDTGLGANDRTGYVSDATQVANITDLGGQQGNMSRPEAKTWTGPIPHNLNTKVTTLSNKQDSVLPPDAYSTKAPNDTMKPQTQSNRPLPPLAPLTQPPKITTQSPFGPFYNPNNHRGDGSYQRHQDGNHGEGYHHDGDMHQYYRDYHGDDDVATDNNHTGYMKPEERQAPAYDVHQTGDMDEPSPLDPNSEIQNDPSIVSGFKDPESRLSASLIVNGDEDTPSGECPPRFERVPQFRSCYLFEHMAVNHNEALTYCRTSYRRAHLVSIETREEYIYLKGRASIERKLLQGWQGWWTAGVYNYKINEFIWGTTGRVISKLDSRWRKPLLLQPYRKTCVWLVPLSGLPFGNFFCNQKTGFICEIDF